MKNYKITLDLIRIQQNPKITVKQADLNAVNFIFTIENDGETVDLTGKTVTLIIKEPTGTTISLDCDITEPEQGICEITLSNAAYDQAGLHIAELRILEGLDFVAVTPRFEYTSLESIAPTVAPAEANKTVAIVTLDVTSAAATLLSDLLTEQGYTPTIFAEADVTATNLADFGSIALTRYSGYENADTAVVPDWYSHINGYLDNGKPLLLGKSIYGTLTSGYIRSLTYNLGIGLENTDTFDYTTFYRSVDHVVNAGTGSVTFATSADYLNKIYEAEGYSGTAIATTAATITDQLRVIACEKGLVTANGNTKTLNARVVYGGFVYNRYGYTQAGKDYIGRMFDWLLGLI